MKDPSRTRFVYRDRLWQGADMVGLGVASFGHVNGVHVQNVDTWETYSAAVGRGELPLGRAYRPTDEERMIRELVLQLKRGSIRPAYFSESTAWTSSSVSGASSTRCLPTATWPTPRPTIVSLTRDGLLRVDALLSRFFLPQHAGIRYT